MFILRRLVWIYSVGCALVIDLNCQETNGQNCRFVDQKMILYVDKYKNFKKIV